MKKRFGGVKSPSYINDIEIKVMIKNYDFQAAQELMYTKEVLTQEERDLCMDFMPKMVEAYLFHNTWNNTYLNLKVYSEVEKEKRDLQIEMGI